MRVEASSEDLINGAGFRQVEVIEKRVPHAFPDMKLGLDSPVDEH
jgi:hypothetical protein